MLNRKNLLAAALTSASLAALTMPTSAWAQATPNSVADCAVAVESTGTNPAATQFDPVTGDPILDPVTGDPVLVAAGDPIPFSTQCGIGSTASGSGATALGNVSIADGAFSTAVGAGSFAIADRSIALGAGAFVAAVATDSVAIGNGSEAVDALTVSFGRKADLSDPLNPIDAITRRLTNITAGIDANDAANVGQLNVAINNAVFNGVNPFVGISTLVSQDSATFGEDSIAIGAGTNVVGISSVGIGTFATANGEQSAAFGFGAFAGSNESVAIGGDASVGSANLRGIAIGIRSFVFGLGVNDSVAIGSDSLADAADTVSFGAGANTLGIAEKTRRLVNIKAGTADNDAVNLGQVNTLISQAALGGGGVPDKFVKVSAGGTVGGVIFTPVDAVASGTRSVAIGGNAKASADNSVALGEGSDAVAANTVSVGGKNLKRKITNVDQGLVAAGSSDAVTGAQLFAATVQNAFIGVDTSNFGTAALVGTDAVALGGNTNAAGLRSVAIGSGSVTASGDADIVSFGSSTIKRRLINLKDGSLDTDATTLGQVKLLIGEAKLGGGAGGGVVVPASLFVAVKEVAGAAPANAAVAGTVALGGASNATLAGAVAIGEGSNALATNATALGAGAKVEANANNSVALGSGSIATAANTVSIGSGVTGDAFATRRLVNVTAGTDATDAVNVGQLNLVKDDVALIKGDITLLKNAASAGGAGGGFLAVNVDAAAVASAATGIGSIAAGSKAVASGNDSVAIGTGAIAKNGAAVSIGLGNTASGDGAVAIGDPNTATGQGAVALGFTNTATGLAAVALGSESNALGVSAVAIGDGARAALDKKTAGSLEAFADSNIAIGRKAQATAQTTIAIGNGAVANDEDATVIGDKSQAGFHATAVGGEVIASAAGAQAFGWQTNATGVRSTAVGFRANALAEGAMAIGANATVRASDTNSTAIGIGATTSRADQLVLGRAAGVAQNGTPFKGTSVTIADIAASTAAQVGPTDVMTVDATGTVGRDASIRPAIASLQAGQQELFDLANLNRREARRGIAAASALVSAPMPSEPGKTSVVAGTAFYRGEGAFSVSFNHRLNLEAPVSFGGGIAHSGGKDTVVRAHVATEF
jgi:autotransporter adhesin